ncbi:alpha/beta hydrolase [Pseudomonas sp. RIT-PI-AD]|uniref:alpha/beta fold hydrolase n=1 Tax=Pseudomonas sp. RIT-PI-AD TaxID=3035294 RepID=UPI0021D8E7F1|nr:alpha/beta hydrolase [Pseudomonas sp. RIT-PI-AD]
MDAVEHRLLDVKGSHLSLYISGPAEGRPVWLLHGFPECWYAWRHQIAALAAEGYRVCVPEMRGYGQSSAPSAPEAYDLQSLCGDIRLAMDALGQDRIAVVGHDWGAPVAWHLALLEPQRIAAVAGLSVPYGGHAKRSPLESMRSAFAGRFLYILYFQEPGVAEAELDADPARTLRMMMHGCSAAVPKDLFLREKPADARLLDGMPDPGVPPAWCGETAFQHYLDSFAGRGFRGALNWYRNFERNWRFGETLSDARIEQPALYLLGDKDPVGTLEAQALKRMPECVPRLEQHLLEACGHWMQGERPAEVNAYLVNFLGRHYPAHGG